MLETKSKALAGTLGLPVSVDEKGSSDDKPIILEGIKHIDLRGLLKIIYPL